MGKSKKVLITGATGQDGSYLVDLLLEKGYEVHTIVRRVAVDDHKRLSNIWHIKDQIKIHGATLESYPSLYKVIQEVKPDEIYHLAAQSFVAHSFDDQFSTMNVNINGTHYILSAMLDCCPKSKIYFAATSEMFGNSPAPQNENTPFMPRSIYGVTKLTSFQLVKHFREAYNIFGCSGILFNHESILKNSPLIIKDSNNEIDIFPIEEVFKAHKYEGIKDRFKGLSVWNGTEWTKILGGSAYCDRAKPLKLIQTRSACCELTLDHTIFNIEDKDIEAEHIKIGDSLFEAKFPEFQLKNKIDLNLCKFLGFVVGDGYIPESGDHIRLVGCDKDEILRYAELIMSMFGFSCNITNTGKGNFDGCVTDIWIVKKKRFQSLY